MDTITKITDIADTWESSEKHNFIVDLLLLLGHDKQKEILVALENQEPVLFIQVKG